MTLLRRLTTWRGPRRLTTVELAEGALLADIAAVLELLSVYVPFGGAFFRAFVPVVFAVLVLRRGLYVGLVAAVVAGFLVGILTGLTFILSMLWASGAGLYLGFTMGRRLPHAIVVLVGTTGAALAACVLLVLFQALSGVPIETLADGLRKAYESAVAAVAFAAPYLGLANWWRQGAYPLVSQLAELILARWLLALALAVWVFFLPLVVTEYVVANVLVRVLGHDVRPFPGEGVDRALRRAAGTLARTRLWRGLAGQGGARA